LALLLALLAGAFVLGERGMRRFGLQRRQSGVRRAASRTDIGRAKWLAIAWLTMLAMAALGVPLWALFARLAESVQRGVSWQPLLSATGNTIFVAALGGVIALALAAPLAVLIARYRGRAVTVLESVSYLGNALPGIVVGLAMTFAVLAVIPGLYQTAFVLAVAYAVMYLPKALGPTKTSIASVGQELEDTARTLSWTLPKVWVRLTARLAAPGLAAGLLIVVLTAMKELPATLLLRPIGMETLATEIWSRTSVNAFGPAAPYAAMLLVVAALPAWLLSREEQL
jgi:iron(III) transport system permease protein